MEARSEDDDRIPVGDLGFGKATMKHFVENYNKVNSYAISQIPELMEEDIEVPTCLRYYNAFLICKKANIESKNTSLKMTTAITTEL